MRCPSSRPKRRTPRGRGKSKGYKRGMRGHSWEGHGKDRRCSKCGEKPQVWLLKYDKKM